MLLGASGSKAGLTVDLEVATDPTKTGDAGVPHGNELLAFATAANRRSDVLPQARAALAAVVGHEGLVEAAATVAIFNGLVRVADGTGIQLDPSMLTSTAETRAALGNRPVQRRCEFAGCSDSTSTGRCWCDGDVLVGRVVIRPVCACGFRGRCGSDNNPQNDGRRCTPLAHGELASCH